MNKITISVTINMVISMFLPQELETSRLILQVPKLEDVHALHEAIIVSLPQLKPWCCWAQSIPILDELKTVTERIHQLIESRDYFAWRLYLKGTKTMVGSIDLHRWDWDIAKCEIGFWGRSDFSKKGYITEGVECVVTHLLSSFDIKRIEALCDTRNVAAHRVVERVGFVREGILRNYERDVKGELCDQIVYSRISSSATTL